MNELEVIKLEETKKKLAKGFINYGGIFVSVCLMFAVVVIVTTDVKVGSIKDIADLGMDFFLLLFCAYASYISCADSGTRAGLATDAYTETLAKFNEWKDKIVKGNMQVKLAEFCRRMLAKKPSPALKKQLDKIVSDAASGDMKSMEEARLKLLNLAETLSK